MPIEHVRHGYNGRTDSPADAALRETRDYFRQFLTPGVSVIDELIADRRAEAAAECATAEPNR